MAYLDIDYKGNVARLERVLHPAWCARHTGSGLSDHDLYHPTYLPGYLTLLFRKCHDPALVDTILCMDSHEPAVYAACTSAVAYLWDDDAPSLLACAASSTAKVGALAGMLSEVCRLLGDDEIRALYLQRLQQSLCSPHSPQSRVAMSIMSVLANDPTSLHR